MNKVQLINVEKNYNSHEKLKIKEKGFNLHIPNLIIEEGEFFGLLGPSGCGKSTLLKLVAGLLEMDKGNIYIENRDISMVTTEKRNIGMVFQEPLLFPHMTLKDNVAFGLKMRKVKGTEREEEVSKILSIVGLKGLEKRYPNELSGGQQQRGAIARALVCKPNILLMDEPFSALDPKLREEMRGFIKELQKKYNITIIFVTHDKEEAFSLFHRMAIMEEGKIVQIGSPKELYEKPKNMFVSRFLGIKNIFTGNIKEDYFYGEGFKLYIGMKYRNNLRKNLCNTALKFEKTGETEEASLNKYLAIKPEGCKVIKELKEGFSNSKSYNDNFSYIHGEVKNTTFIQGFWHLEVNISLKCSLYVIQINEENMDFSPGDRVIVKCNLDKIDFIGE
ncbi:ABC transporter ATP-binding protein [Haloimpatiens lingqiaonensis]|uniref:ABC transporter ATP-binding protein n=1 Tax=Haloimpatiens lingqiaonensis TaxID=1380675 RepID=UPI0010FD8B2A|nr:ABC transporter ATP-binding protein [Haloimpatiens lingqiaonensis]